VSKYYPARVKGSQQDGKIYKLGLTRSGISKSKKKAKLERNLQIGKKSRVLKDQKNVKSDDRNCFGGVEKLFPHLGGQAS
jgi:hypothetical protein